MNERVVLTSGDLCRIAGVPMNTLDRWVNAGLLQPANTGMGTGRHRLYTIAEAVAVAAGMTYRAEGADPHRISAVVRFLSSLPIEHLEAELAAGRTFPMVSAMTLMDDMPWPAGLLGLMVKPPSPAELPPGPRALLERIDLKRILKDVRRKIDKLQGCLRSKLTHRPAKKRGRSSMAGVYKR